MAWYVENLDKGMRLYYSREMGFSVSRDTSPQWCERTKKMVKFSELALYGMLDLGVCVYVHACVCVCVVHGVCVYVERENEVLILGEEEGDGVWENKAMWIVYHPLSLCHNLI